VALHLKLIKYVAFRSRDCDASLFVRTETSLASCAAGLGLQRGVTLYTCQSHHLLLIGSVFLAQLQMKDKTISYSFPVPKYIAIKEYGRRGGDFSHIFMLQICKYTELSDSTDSKGG
jgi:hypothetical protein